MTACSAGDDLTYFRDHQITLGVSACLLGQRVRYDGGDKEQPWLVGVLGRYVIWVPVCPEVELGLGVPREPVALVRAPDVPGGVRLIAAGTRRDHTAAMQAYAAMRVDALAVERLSGYVLKSRSPSCGVAGVKVRGGAPYGETGRGMFAAALMARFPGMPLVEEHALVAAGPRAAFLDSVRAYHQAMQRPGS